jgi:perosamine synthetase
MNPACYYDIEEAGYKLNMSDIAAAMGLSQLRKVRQMRERRCEIAMKYNRAFRAVPEFQIPVVEECVETSWHIYILRLQLEHFSEHRSARDEFVEALRLNHIATTIHYRPLHLHSHYKHTFGYHPTDFPVSLREYQRVVSLPIYSRMSDANVDAVIDAVCSSISRGLL